MLVQAGLACLAEGGIAGFTVDAICRRAQASRGLIAHHFGSKDGLLAAVYEAAYQPMLAQIRPEGPPLGLGALLSRMLGAEGSDPATLRIWLALWGEIAVNPVLRAAHRRNYGLYRATVEQALADHARARGLVLDVPALAITVIGLVDGLWLEECLDPEAYDAPRMLSAARALLEPLLGRLDAGPAPDAGWTGSGGIAPGDA